jgi:tetratricopeptide (TPR) repeat protein
MRYLEVVVLAALAASAASRAQPAPPPSRDHVFTIGGPVRIDPEGDGDWFRLIGQDMQFLLPEGEERATHWRIVSEAAERGLSLRIRIDAAAGRLAPEGNRIVYPVCSIGTATGARFGDEARNCPPAAPAPGASERLLALGLAQTEQNRERARQLLVEALSASPSLPPPARAVALRARALAAQVLALDVQPGEEAHDRLLAEALADLRELAALLPDRPGPRLLVAQILSDLGGYREAIETLREVGARWPEQAFSVAIGVVTVQRRRGDYNGALRHLDRSAAGETGAGGMMFHYHRAWTLMLLRRDAEALDMIDRGLATQPDYVGAHQLRACVLGRLGRLEEALAAQRIAREGLQSMPDPDGAYVRSLDLLSRSSEAELADAIAAGRRRPVDRACGFLDRWSRPRTRSPLLRASNAAN